ncbi:hypothetical protein FT643_06880 [Ketobacter sp. MCCC 1A13808]|uniref:hypothetical protein n=1 Tax=Ketobacter sp. MCCC 1A13808 TaxID=2602738 RepID=UPI0012EB5AD3|nr:hypothetical protein [Ketobacter sp. MCCC 1A13808]MVF11868.1 hypothetical protein [Ketobacter sp. MCCC 1A13808]
MNEKDIVENIGHILYNFCFHSASNVRPLSEEEIQLLIEPSDYRDIRRETYCKCLLWARHHPEFDYQSVLHARTHHNNQEIYDHLMAMSEQLERKGIFEAYSNEKPA